MPCRQPRGHLVPVANGGHWLTQSHAVGEGRAQTCASALLDHEEKHLKKIFFIEVWVIYKVVLITAVWQTFSDACTHTRFFVFFSTTDYHRISNVVPCAVPWAPVAYLPAMS